MRTFSARPGLLLATALAACTSLQEVSPDTTVTCSATSECPGGRVCNRGRCVNPDAIDTTPPDIAAGSVTVTPARVKGGGTVTVTLQATELLEAAPTVALGLVPPVAMACTVSTGLAYSCSYTATGHENGDLGGDIAIDVRMRDLAGNDTARSSVATISFDFTPPSPTIASVGYSPAPANPLPSVRLATAGTLVQLAVAADEKLSTTAPPALVGRLGGSTLTFTLAPGRLGGTDAIFEATVPAGLPDGDYALEITWTDQVGNTGTAAVSGVVVRVKTSRPTLTVDQSQVTYLRSPWASPKPEFELAPADPLSPASALPATTFTIDSGAPSAVRVWPDASRSWLLAAFFPGAGGLWPRAALQPVDSPTAWVTALDDAGNESDPVKVLAAEWVATPALPASGISPHTLDASWYLRETLLPDRETAMDPPSRASLGAVGGGHEVVRAHVAVRRVPTAVAPSWTTNTEGCMAYDAGRGVVVAQVLDSFGTPSAPRWKTLEWDGWNWADRTPSELRCPGWQCAVGVNTRVDEGGIMAYHAARGRVVMLTGYAIYEWDGAYWQFADSRHGLNCPFGAYGFTRGMCARMAYDGARRKLVVFGGSDASTWEWDGTWLQRTTPVAPPPVVGHGLVYDARRGRVVLLGGCLAPCQDPKAAGALSADVWEYDGTSWTKMTQGGAAPGPRLLPYAVYDSATQRVVLAGGLTEGGAPANDARAWDGAAWTDVTPLTGSFNMRSLDDAATQPDYGVTPHLAAFDSARERMVLVDLTGSLLTTASETWEWDGTSFERVALGSLVPPARDSHRMAYDERRGRTVLVGGLGINPNVQLADVWEWNGVQWSNVTPAAGASPDVSTGHAMTYDPVAARVVLFGGWRRDGGGGDSNELWEWDGAAWTMRATSGGPPAPRSNAAIAYDRKRGVLVVLGGDASVGGTWVHLGDTWELTGPVAGVWTWTLKASPPAFLWPAMLFDGTRSVAFIASDPDLAQERGSVLTWDGAAWTDITPAAPSTWAYFPPDSPAWDGTRHRGVSPGLNTFYEWTGNAFEYFPPSIGAAFPRIYSHSQVSFDSARNRAVIFETSGQTWEVDSESIHTPAGPRQKRTPMIEFAADYSGTGFGTDDITGLRVRAVAGARFGDVGTGASLMGWRTGGVGFTPGQWVRLTSNPASAPAPLSWDAPALDLPFFFVARDAKVTFQLRPAGQSAPTEAESEVDVDYIEVRVRYTAP